jgi:AraC-like DNA-binding protein
LYPAEGNGEGFDLKAKIYEGSGVSILYLTAQGLARVLFRNRPDRVSLAITDFGQSKGSAGGREFLAVPKRFSFLLLSEEVLQLIPKSTKVSGFVIEFPQSLLIKESRLHEIEDPDPLSLLDTIPGHETLLLTFCSQLLDLASSPDSPARHRLMQPLEASILSLVANLVGSTQSLIGSTPPAHPQEAHVQKALDYLEAHLADQITLTELCNSCNVSARTLQVSFQAVTSSTPLQMLQELRLNRLHQLLLNRVDVRSACEMAGLQPTGRTAANYKKMFGRLPSQTLNRGSG